MPTTDRDGPAELIESIHQPWKATVAECLRRWRALPPRIRSQSYLVVEERTGIRRTLNAAKIADLAALLAA